MTTTTLAHQLGTLEGLGRRFIGHLAALVRIFRAAQELSALAQQNRRIDIETLKRVGLI